MRFTPYLLLFIPSLCFAGGMDRYQLMAGSGVAHPSMNHATASNPAGLIGVDRFKLVTGAGTGSDSLNNFDANVGLLFGNDSARWAGTIGIDTGPSGGSGVFVGAATHIRSIKSSIGVGYGRSNGAGGGLDAGIIVNPATLNTIGDAELRFAGTVYGLDGNISLGAGAEWDSGRTFSLIADIQAPRDLSLIELHPALLISSGSTAFTLGYSFIPANGSNGSLTLGVSMNISRIDFQFYLNQLDHLFLSLAFKL